MTSWPGFQWQPRSAYAARVPRYAVECLLDLRDRTGWDSGCRERDRVGGLQRLSVRS